jgi:hypothetical protein
MEPSFSTPNYKVWVGNYKSRIEAERNLIDIKKYIQTYIWYDQQGNSTFYYVEKTEQIARFF